MHAKKYWFWVNIDTIFDVSLSHYPNLCLCHQTSTEKKEIELVYIWGVSLFEMILRIPNLKLLCSLPVLLCLLQLQKKR